MTMTLERRFLILDVTITEDEADVVTDLAAVLAAYGASRLPAYPIDLAERLAAYKVTRLPCGR